MVGLQYDQVFRLLSTPDPSTNHRTAHELHEPTTCSWFIESNDFDGWLNGPSVLVLYGLPGCGKTVLISTIIEHTGKYVAEKKDAGLAYFYFDFNDGHKQTLEGLLLSLTLQLASQQQNQPEEFGLFCDRFRNGQRRPNVKDIRNVLVAIVRQFQSVYFIMDALDECCEQEGVLDLIADLVQASPSINVLMASRKFIEMRLALGNVLTHAVSASLDGISLDIRTYVRNSLSRDPKLRVRPDHVKSEIEAALVSGAHGMLVYFLLLA